MRWRWIVTSAGVSFAAACGGASGGIDANAAPPPIAMAAAPAAATPGTPMSAAPSAGAGAMQPASSSTLQPTAAGTTTPPSAATTPSAGSAGGAASPPADPTAMPSADAMAMDTGCIKCRIPKDCQAFPLEGLQYSPGGTTLPSKCRPFHPTTNNPYAIRCIDAMPNFKTKFPGDEYCILPPPPDKGIQVGPHAQGRSAEYWKQMWAGDLSGYENPSKDFVLEPGDELTQNYRSKDAGNAMEMKYYRTYFRMRTGSHHMIVTMHDSTEPDGWIEGVGEALPGMFDPNSGATLGILGGEQRPDDSTPVSLEKPPEDAGLYLTFPQDPSIIFNMHHFNTTDGELLREGWINIWWEDDAKTAVSWYMGLDIGQVVGLSVNAGQVIDMHYSWPISQDTRLVRVFGHRHFWTTNFSAWIKHSDGSNDIAYQSYDWFDMPTYRYDSVTMNPKPDPVAKTDGAMSGIVTLKAGDEFHFNCHIEFTDQRQATDMRAPSPTKIGTLRFANEAYNGEMCINFGNAVGSLGLPAADSSPVPDFAKVTR